MKNPAQLSFQFNQRWRERRDLYRPAGEPIRTAEYDVAAIPDNGTAKHALSVEKPLDTVTAKDRFALVEPGVASYGLDIRFRMLTPVELAGAMGFVDYDFTGTRSDQIRQIGNAVPVRTAAALCRAILES